MTFIVTQNYVSDPIPAADAMSAFDHKDDAMRPQVSILLRNRDLQVSVMS